MELKLHLPLGIVTLITIAISSASTSFAGHTQAGVTHNTAHVNHTWYAGYTADWSGVPASTPDGPASVNLWGPQEFPNHTCSGNTITITEEESTTDHVTVNAGVEVTAGIKATAGNALLGEVEADARATLNAGAGWARTGTRKISLSEQKDHPKCKVFTKVVTANKWLAAGDVAYFACRFLCSEAVSLPVITYYCGDGTLAGDGKGHDAISRPWSESNSNQSPCPDCL